MSMPKLLGSVIVFGALSVVLVAMLWWRYSVDEKLGYCQTPEQTCIKSTGLCPRRAVRMSRHGRGRFRPRLHGQGGRSAIAVTGEQNPACRSSRPTQAPSRSRGTRSHPCIGGPRPGTRSGLLTSEQKRQVPPCGVGAMCKDDRPQFLLTRQNPHRPTMWMRFVDA